jgi:hypothetical protein
MWTVNGRLTTAIRQNTCLIAFGRALFGFWVSAAARPTSSVPENENAAVTRRLQNPWNPLLKAPGLTQYRPPIYPSPGCPPQFITTPRILKPVSQDK